MQCKIVEIVENTLKLLLQHGKTQYAWIKMPKSFSFTEKRI